MKNLGTKIQDGELAQEADFSYLPASLKQKAENIQQEILAYLLQALAHSQSPSEYQIGHNDVSNRFLGAIAKLAPQKRSEMQETALRILNSPSEKQQYLGPRFSKIDFRKSIYLQLARQAVIQENIGGKQDDASKVIPYSGSLSGKLQLRLKKVKMKDETNGFLGSEAGKDEIYLGLLCVDSKEQASKVNPFHVGNFDEWSYAEKKYNPYKQLKNFSIPSNKNNQKVHATFMLFEADGVGMYEIVSIGLDILAKELASSTYGISIIVKKVIDVIVNIFAGDDAFPTFTHAQTIHSNTNSYTKNYWYWTKAHGGEYHVFFDWKYTAPQKPGGTGNGNPTVACAEDIFNMPVSQTQACFNHWISKGKWPIGVSINEDLKVMESFQTGKNHPVYIMMTKQGFIDKFNKYKKSMRPDKIDVVNTPQGLRYSCNWTPVDGAFLTFIDMSQSDFSNKWTNYRKQGYVVVDLHGYSRNNKVMFAATWVKRNHKNYASYVNMTKADYQQRFKNYYKNGSYPTRFSAYKTAHGMRYAANWEKKVGKFVHYFDMGLNEVKTKNVQYKSQGYRLYHFQTYDALNGTDLYSAIWYKPIRYLKNPIKFK